MASVEYKGDIVNSTMSQISSIQNQISTLSSNIRSATNQIVSARGFQQYVGGISSDSFSSVVEQSGSLIQEFVSGVRQKQIAILSYSGDQGEVNAFLDSLSRKEYDSLDLSEIDSYIGFDRRAGNVLRALGSDVAAIGLGAVEGVADLFETGADLVTLAGTGLASIFTGAYDLITGSNATKQMWEDTKAKVSEKKVESIFNSFYENNEIGKYIKDTAYQFDTVRGISKGLGYTAGMIGLNVLTGGLASGLGIGASGSIGAGQLAMTAGVLGFSNGTEEAWADGADIGKGLLYGAATGVWEGAQWYAGAKINQFGGLGDKVAKGLFKGAAKGVGIRIGMDAADSALEGFVQPALSMIYKDYGGATLLENYKTAFEKAGGWKNVATQAVMGGIASTVGEAIGARRLLKEAKQAGDESLDTATKQIMSGDGDADSARAIFAVDTEGDVSRRAVSGYADSNLAARSLFDDDLSAEVFEASGDFSRSTRHTIDGEWIKVGDDTAFTTITGSNVPKDYKWFNDGSYLPSGDALKNSQRGSLKQFESFMKPDDMIQEINKNKKNLSGRAYTDLMGVAGVFRDAGYDLNANELKLIAFHSEGNVGRIKSVLSMVHGDMGSDTIDDLAERLSTQVFRTSVGSSDSLRKAIANGYIDAFRNSGTDEWKSADQIFRNIDSDDLIRQLRGINPTSESRIAALRALLPDSVSSDTIMKVAASDGYIPSIRSILESDGSIASGLLDQYSLDTASSIFELQNRARIKSVFEVNDHNFEKALKLVSQSSDYIQGYKDLFKATEYLSEAANRKAYYSLVDRFVDEGGLPFADAVTRARYVNIDALQGLGKKVYGSATSGDLIFNWQSGVTDYFDNAPFGALTASDYMNQHYRNANGKIDGSRIVSDFQSLMNKKINNLSSATLPAGADLDKSIEANRLFVQSYVDAFSNPDNPNRGEALRFMSKILELEDANRGITIMNNGGFSGSYCQNTTINFANYTVDGKNAATVFHEDGHFVFGTGYSTNVPSDFSAIRANVANRLENDSVAKSVLASLANNDKEAAYYSAYLAEKEMNSIVRQAGYAGIEDYRQSLIQKYSNLSYGGRSISLSADSSSLGTLTIGEFNKFYKDRMDFKDVEACANIELNSIRSKITDRIFRDKFSNYATASSIVDSTSRGSVRIHYGHGAQYFETRPFPDIASYHELIADYSALKVSGDNQTIRLLRFLLGDELIDNIDRTYQGMLK